MRQLKPGNIDVKRKKIHAGFLHLPRAFLEKLVEKWYFIRCVQKMKNLAVPGKKRYERGKNCG